MPWRFFFALTLLCFAVTTVVAQELHFRSEQELLQGLEDAAVEEQAAIAQPQRREV